MSRGYLLDSSIVSELTKARRDAGAVEWMESADPERCYLSVLTLGERRRGTAKLAATDAERAAGLETWIDGLADRCAARILEIDRGVAETWGRLAVGGVAALIATVGAALRLFAHGNPKRSNTDFAGKALALAAAFTVFYGVLVRTIELS